jgi:hypothetical protein
MAIARIGTCVTTGAPSRTVWLARVRADALVSAALPTSRRAGVNTWASQCGARADRYIPSPANEPTRSGSPHSTGHRQVLCHGSGRRRLHAVSHSGRAVMLPAATVESAKAREASDPPPPARLSPPCLRSARTRQNRRQCRSAPGARERSTRLYLDQARARAPSARRPDAGRRATRPSTELPVDLAPGPVWIRTARPDPEMALGVRPRPRSQRRHTRKAPAPPL